jgi:UDP-glucose 4-epimerase
MKILVTGVAGFIGSFIAKKLQEDGHEIIGIDDLSMGKIKNIPDGITFLKIDLSDPNSIERIPSGCKKILHLAGQSSGEISFDNPIEDLKKNTVSTLNLIQYGIKNKSERILYASSMSVYGNVPNVKINEEHICSPLSCYGVGKLAAEQYLKIYSNQLPFVIFRMFNVYGPGQDLDNLRQGMVSIYLAQALSKNIIEVKGNLNRFRDFIFIEDVSNAWLKATFSMEAKNQIFNLGTGERTTVADLLNKICNCIPGTTYFVNGSTPGDQNGIFADIEKLKRILNISKFTNLDNGLNEFTKWSKESINN